TLQGAGTKSTSSTGSLWDKAIWEEDEQYVVFRNVSVSSAQELLITVAPGASGYAHINGMQLAPTYLAPPPPSITTQPQSASIGLGGAATFSVTATGSAPLSYQWRKAGTDIAGATASSYSIAGAQFSDAGNYSVAVSNPGGTTLSSEASLTVSGGGCITAPSGLANWWPADNNGNNLGGSLPTSLRTGASFQPGLVDKAFDFNGTSGYA